MTYKPAPTKTEGGLKKAVTSDDETRDILCQILTQLKIMNTHLAIMTEMALTEDDTQGE